jgi:hypothetical protein
MKRIGILLLAITMFTGAAVISFAQTDSGKSTTKKKKRKKKSTNAPKSTNGN